LALWWPRDTNTHTDGYSDCDSNGYSNSSANGDAYNDFNTSSNTQAASDFRPALECVSGGCEPNVITGG
jgi:hypothetical protein